MGNIHTNEQRRYSIFNQHNKMKELIKKLTEHYEWCIQNMPEEEWFVFALENKVIKGICHCASLKFDLDIYHSNFIKEYLNGNSMFICEPPCLCGSFKEALESLRTRHKRLLEMADYKE